MMVVIFATSVWTPMVWVVRDVGAANSPGPGSVRSTDPTGIDGAAEYERAAVTLDGEVLF